MITKEQAMTVKYFHEINEIMLSDIKRNWRVSGKCKTWKTRPNEFKLPIKHGLYRSSYLTHENAHLFDVAE